MSCGETVYKGRLPHLRDFVSPEGKEGSGFQIQKAKEREAKSGPQAGPDQAQS